MSELEPLKPISMLRSLDEYRDFSSSINAAVASRFDESVIAAHAMVENWVYPGYSEPCRQHVMFGVDMLYGGRKELGQWVPNLRERLVCPISQLNNRQRLMATLVRQNLPRQGTGKTKILFTETGSHFFDWCSATLEECELIGADLASTNPFSETLDDGPSRPRLAEASLDMIVSQDVFKHLPSPEAGLRDCARLLKPNGKMLMTLHFFPESANSVARARIAEGELIHNTSPEHHGDPNDIRTLVFTEFGWDVLSLARQCGFADAWVGVYHAPRMGHIGGGLNVFHLLR